MSWWGTIWTSAMGQIFNEAPELSTGARLARRLEVSVEMSPGSMTLRDPDEAWVASLGVRQLDDGQWETLLRTVAADPHLTAAIITGELPLELHGKAVALGCAFTPEPAEIGIDCSCPDWHEPCRHVGALIALVADMIDVDPWLLVMLRGRSRDDVAEAVRRLRSKQRGVAWVESSDEPRGADPGVAAAAALRAEAAPLPPGLNLLRKPGRPAAHRPPPVDAGLEPDDLEQLVADAARRAHELLAGSDDGDVFALTAAQDLARIAASTAKPGGPDHQRLAGAAGLSLDELRRMALAWDRAGVAGVEVVSAPYEATQAQVARALALLPEGRVSSTGVTAGSVQLRVDAGGGWWRFGQDHELGWVVVDGPADDPTELRD